MSSLYLRVILIVIIILQSKNVAAIENQLKIHIEEIGSGSEIRFNSRSKLSSAIFLRGNKLWFAVNSRVNEKEIDSRTGVVVTNFSTVQNNGKYTIGFFEIANPNSYEITSTRLDNNIIIKISPYDNSVLSDELFIDRNISKDVSFQGNFVNVSLNENSGDIITFTDPDVGDKLFIIPEMISAKTGGKSFVDFAILESLSGLVIRKLNDSLNVKVEKSTLRISSSVYLNILSDANFGTGVFTGSNLKLDPNSKAILDLSPYSNTPQEFTHSLNKINGTIYNTYDSTVKAEEFLNLSLFLLNNKWYLESKSIIEIVNRYENIISSSYRIKMIVGAIYFMADAFSESSDIINSINLANVPLRDRSEIRFWQKVANFIDAKNANNTEAIEYNIKKIVSKLVERKSNFLSSYNEDIITKLSSVVADAAIEINRIDILQNIISVISKGKVDLQGKEMLDYLQGYMLFASENYNKALIVFRSCIENGTNRHYYAKCRLHYLNSLYKTGQISDSDYINNLQGLSTIWRGDDLEITILDTLASFYDKNGYVADAIRTWKIIASIDSGSYKSLIATTKASKAFIKYFNESSGTKLEKLAFFYEFQDLIPLGDEGDAIILQTAAFMIDLDLIDQAAKIIEYQIKNRLIGISREYVINNLVKTYNSVNRYELGEKAVELFSTFPLNIVNPVIEERKYLYVESLIGTGQMQEAIALLYNDKGPKADELRAKAFFQLHDWESFNYNSEPYLYSIRYSNGNLSDSDYIKILKQNISYLNTNQIGLLNDLYLDMKPRLKKNQKNAERNRIFYNIANELQDSSGMTATKKSRLEKLIKELISS
jgi:hypothetical protein